MASTLLLIWAASATATVLDEAGRERKPGVDFLLQEVSCQEEGDCSPKETGLTCVKGSCVCPFYQALNVSSCECQEAAKCEDECPAQHNGRRCEDVPDAPDLPHVAAWDHPSLDYIPKTEEEDIVFTLAMAKDTVRMSNASTIHVVDEEVTDYNLNNDNHGYVDDVDDPRHD